MWIVDIVDVYLLKVISKSNKDTFVLRDVFNQFSAFRDELLERYGCPEPCKLWDLACSEACQCNPKQ